MWRRAGHRRLHEGYRRSALRRGGIKAKVFAFRYMTALPGPETLRQEIIAAQHAFES